MRYSLYIRRYPTYRLYKEASFGTFMNGVRSNIGNNINNIKNVAQNGRNYYNYLRQNGENMAQAAYAAANTAIMTNPQLSKQFVNFINPYKPQLPPGMNAVQNIPGLSTVVGSLPNIANRVLQWIS